MVEWDGLENRCMGNCTEGSNPSLSANRNNTLRYSRLIMQIARKLPALLYSLAAIGMMLCQNNICHAQKNIGTRIDSLFTAYLDSGFAGSALVSEKNKISLKKGYGYANNETRIKNTPSTLFNIASLGKQFTAYAVLLLEKRGLLNTSDPVSKYIEIFNDSRDSVTIHHLLLHSSGLFKQSVNLDYSTRKNFIQSVKNGGAESLPGEKYRYSNAGYSMLAAIVEIVSGEPFEKFLIDNIFTPCKMENTGYPWETRMNMPLFATGYNNKRQPVAPQIDFWAARGPGHLVTSVEDLFKWIQAVQNEKFITPDIRNKIFKDWLPGRETYSWNKASTARQTRFYHKGGGRPDFESQLMWFPDDEVVIIFLINNDYNLRSRLFTKIKMLMD